MENSGGRWLSTLFLLAVAGAGIFLVAAVGGIVKLLLISALLAYIIDPAAVFLEARGMSRTLATVTVFLALALAAAFLLFLFLPVLAKEIIAIRNEIGSGRAGAMAHSFGDALSARLAFLGGGNIDIADRIQHFLTGIADWLFSHFLDVLSLITNLVFVPIFTFFLLKDGRSIKKRVIGVVPNRYFEFSLSLLHKMDLQLGNYLRGQFMDAVLFGLLSTAALWFLGVKYFLLIGTFAGLANLVPFLGPIAGGTLAVVISVIDTGNFTQGLYIVLAFALIKLIDDAVVQPLVVARSVHMHPLTVLLAVLAGGKLFGILGMLLSVPATGFVKVVLQESVGNFRRYHMT
jgi:putative permease